MSESSPKEPHSFLAFLPLLSAVVTAGTVIASVSWMTAQTNAELVEHERRLTAMESTREARWVIITTALAEVREGLAGVRVAVEDLRNAPRLIPPSRH